MRQCGAATANGLALDIQQLDAQSLQHASTAVVGGAAANAHNQVARPGIQCSGDELARAVAGGDEWVALVGGHQGQAAGCGHFNHGGVAVAGQCVKAGNALAQRGGDFDFYAATVRRPQSWLAPCLRRHRPWAL